MTDDTRPTRKRHFQDQDAARRAGRKGHEAQKERRAAEEAAEAALQGLGEGVAVDGMAADAAIARRRDKVVAKLQAKAEAGDVAAARELREWQRLDPAAEAGRAALRLAVLIAALPIPVQRELHDWLVEHIVPANGDNREGLNESDQALPVGAEEQEAAARADGHPREPRDSDAARAAEPQPARDTPEHQPEPVGPPAGEETP